MRSQAISTWTPTIALGLGLVFLSSADAHEWSRPPGCEVPDCVFGVDCRESFPLAEGYGSFTPGGRCGDLVLVVDTTTDTIPPAPNSLRWAIQHADNRGLSRTVVFNVDGIINLSRPITFQGDDDSHITIAGETAPGGGIVITGYGFHLQGVHDIIIRHLRFRNIRSFQEIPEPSFVPGTVGDGIEIEGSERIMIDHVSVSWATD